MEFPGIRISVTVLVMALTFSDTALAHGAIAIGVPDDVAAKGLAIGRSRHYQSEDSARLRALEECLTFVSASAETRAQCKVVEAYKFGCSSVAMDPGEGTPGWGYGIDDLAAVAEEEAMQHCRETAGATRVGNCKLSQTYCEER